MRRAPGAASGQDGGPAATKPAQPADGRMLETARLLLRPMRAEDAEDLLRVFADPEVMAAFGGDPFDRPRMERWVRRNLDHQARHGYGLFSVVLKANGLLIGDCGLERMEIGAAVEVELGYDLRGDYWRRGLATEAATAVRDYAFRELRLPRLISLIRHGNRASQRVAEKLGMRLTDDITRHGQGYWLYTCSPGEVASARPG